MLDEDDILNEMRKSPVVNLPDKAAGASELQGSPEVTKTKCPTIDPMARDVRHHSNLVLISRREKTTEIMHVTTPWAFKLVSREGHTRLTHKLIGNEFLVRTLTIVDNYVNANFLQSESFFRIKDEWLSPGNNFWCSFSPLQVTAELSVSTSQILPTGKESSQHGC